jgi:arylsulfatase A-like enzyme/Tfp pilus assembly protein PilF
MKRCTASGSRACLAALGVLLAGGCARAPRAAGPNVLLVTLDTVRADRVGCYGAVGAETPALDRLAREGVRFAQASSPVPLTLPAHASILSGLLPPAHGLRNNGAGAFPAARATLATALAGAGYRTAAFVGSFVLDRRFGLGRGFEVYDDEIARGTGEGASLEAERRGDVVVDRALAWLDGAGKEDDRPFFLWVHLYDAHAPYAPPSPYRGRFAGRLYDGEVAFADAQVGRLLAALDRLDLAERTVVAVAADHGEALGAHGELTHGLLLYEPTLRVPLLLRAAGSLAPGRVIETPVSLVDLAPTLAGLVGRTLDDRKPAPAGLSGRDLSAPLLAGAEPPPADLYAETHYPEVFGWSRLAALRHRDAKYIDAPRPELYDLRRDRGEAHDLLAQNAAQGRGFAARVAALEANAVPPPAVAAPDAETAARLASLGYAAAGRAAIPQRPGARGADPKDQLPLFRRYERAHNGLRAGRVAAAAAELERLVAADPGNSVFRGELANAFRQAGDLERAVPLYRAAVKAAPDDPQTWYNLATALEEAGRAEEAVLASREALRRDPAGPEAHNVLGLGLLAAGDGEGARREFARAVELDPRNAPALNNLGNSLRDLGRLAEAETAYRQALAAAPGYAEALNGLGTLAVARDRPAAALPLFDRALALSPAQHEIRLNRGIALDLMGQRAAAIAAYRDFLSAAADIPQFAEQRTAARRLLARLAGPAGAAPSGRR